MISPSKAEENNPRFDDLFYALKPLSCPTSITGIKASRQSNMYMLIQTQGERRTSGSLRRIPFWPFYRESYLIFRFSRALLTAKFDEACVNFNKVRITFPAQHRKRRPSLPLCLRRHQLRLQPCMKKYACLNPLHIAWQLLFQSCFQWDPIVNISYSQETHKLRL